MGPLGRAATASGRSRQLRRLHTSPHRSTRSRDEVGRAVSLGVAIVGCGLIGRKRAASLGSAHLVACADVDLSRARALAATSINVVASDSWETTISRPDVDVVIVATTNDVLTAVSSAALAAGKHVLVEKPAGRSSKEIDALSEAATRANRLARVWFNHRYHPAMR